jgi:hypothetical protein
MRQVTVIIRSVRGADHLNRGTRVEAAGEELPGENRHWSQFWTSLCVHQNELPAKKKKKK